jgi:hypothetical protein
VTALIIVQRSEVVQLGGSPSDGQTAAVSVDGCSRWGMPAHEPCHKPSTMVCIGAAEQQ